MRNIEQILSSLADHRRRWEQRVEAGHGGHASIADFDPTSDLSEVQGFGSNPGALRMLKYEPDRPEPALVVVLHGCTQTAAGYDLGAGWSTLADRYGFMLLLPQQQPANNPNGCFNWFLRGDITRGQGEALSIRQMVETMTRDHHIERSRVFVTGLSAGGAMACAMLAAYPEVFAAGAVIAGLPYGTAANVNEAFESMLHGRDRTAAEWGDLVRAGSKHRGPWPRLSVWHGGADPVVKPDNADQIVKQWTDLHGLGAEPSCTDIVDGYPRKVWRDTAGREVIESYSIPHMAHGTPLATGSADQHCGTPGPFLLDVGISSSYHIAKFWGLTDHPRRAAARRPSRPQASRDIPLTSVTRFGASPSAAPAVPPSAGSGAVDVQAVITNALKAAGLWKSP